MKDKNHFSASNSGFFAAKKSFWQGDAKAMSRKMKSRKKLAQRLLVEKHLAERQTKTLVE